MAETANTGGEKSFVYSGKELTPATWSEKMAVAQGYGEAKKNKRKRMIGYAIIGFVLLAVIVWKLNGR